MMTEKPVRHLSAIGAWAFAFGCALGWDAFVMPWTVFLPKAGPIGSLLGLAVSAVVMAVVAWNFHYMINCSQGPGGVYAYASEAFGLDHGYLCAWFLCLTYVSIVWLDATALPIVVRYLLGGDILGLGFSYNVAGYAVSLGDVAVVAATACAIVAICYWRRLSAVVQTVLALVFAAGLVICFAAAVSRHEGGLKTLEPFFSPFGGGEFFQFLGIFAIAPWLFIGFETISSMSGEFKFPARRSFGIMVAAIVAAAAAYAVVLYIPVLITGDDVGGWPAAVAATEEPNAHAFDTVKGAIGFAGGAVMGCTLLAAIFTNLVGNTVAASRLFAAMAENGGMPHWLGGRKSVCIIALLAIFTSALGQTVIGVVVDVAIVGSAVAYAYTSAATFKVARGAGDRISMATGVVGMALSAIMALLCLFPMVVGKVASIGTVSYFVLVLWSIVGLVLFLAVFRGDTLHRFGRSPVVWISLFAVIIGLSFIWFRQTAGESLMETYDAIVSHHSSKCLEEEHGHAKDDEWKKSLKSNLSIVRRTIVRNNYVQGGLCVLAIAMMLSIYSILRRRERETEQEKAKAKSYFFSTVSHDIRTPLNAIIGFSEMLKSGFKTEEEREQAIDAILVSGRTLLGLINDVLDLSKLESGKMGISPEPTDCAKLLHEVVEVFRVSGAKPDVELRCSVGEMPLLMFDPQRLRQIVFNLVGNAVKFTAKGYVEIRASFSAPSPSAEEGAFRLEVEDTGCGISEEDLKSIGAAYVQLGSNISRNGGTGLGLSICRQLAAAMGGELDVKSELGKGSTFSVAIPGVKVAVGDKCSISNIQHPTSNSQFPIPNSQFAVRRILIVDDSKMNLMVLKAHLKKMGNFDIALASDGKEALDMMTTLDMLTSLNAQPFDLVLTDMWMPQLDGAGLVKAMRANPALAGTRVVVVTADVEFQDKYAEMGFDGILLKPITADKLAEILFGGGR